MTFEHYLKMYHPTIDPASLETSEVRGYWRVKGGCPGGQRCMHAFRGEFGPCQGGQALTISFAEHGKRDDKGRFVSPFREWERQRALGL